MIPKPLCSVHVMVSTSFLFTVVFFYTGCLELVSPGKWKRKFRGHQHQALCLWHNQSHAVHLTSSDHFCSLHLYAIWNHTTTYGVTLFVKWKSGVESLRRITATELVHFDRDICIALPRTIGHLFNFSVLVFLVMVAKVDMKCYGKSK